LLLTLVVVATLPAAGTWSTFVVRTGSMEPSIHVGDVVIGQPFGTDEKVPVGRVMIFRAPPGSGVGSELRVHRVVEALGHETYTTAGDANPTPDAAPVPRANFRSRAIIRVPYVGRPLVWLDDRHYGRLLAWLVLTTLLLSASFRRVDGDPPRDTGPSDRGLRHLAALVRLPVGRHRRPSTVSVRIGVVLGVVGLTLAVPASAQAAFTARTTTGPNTWRAANSLVQAYTSAVMADTPSAFYRLDEASGTSATDTSGNNRTGTYANIASYRQVGALPHNFGYAVGLAANSGRMVAGGTAQTNPTTYSLEMWFRTTTTTGGKLIGFENSRNQSSTTADRTVLMRTDGKLAVMTGTGSGASILLSASALNNGAWHHVVVTVAPYVTGLYETTTLYVDGTQTAASSLMPWPSSYSGYWRVGYGKVPSATSFPSTGNLTGTVDDVAVYTTQLSATRVAAHYAAR
jgi:signal peptidase I